MSNITALFLLMLVPVSATVGVAWLVTYPRRHSFERWASMSLLLAPFGLSLYDAATGRSQWLPVALPLIFWSALPLPLALIGLRRKSRWKKERMTADSAPAHPTFEWRSVLLLGLAVFMIAAFLYGRHLSIDLASFVGRNLIPLGLSLIPGGVLAAPQIVDRIQSRASRLHRRRARSVKMGRSRKIVAVIALIVFQGLGTLLLTYVLHAHS